jgi:tight adherence protein C
VTAVSGAWLGLATSTGLLVVLSRLPWLRRVRLRDRVLPYLRDLSGLASPGLGPRGWPIAPAGDGVDLPGWVRRARADLAGRLDRALGGAESVRRRLGQLGSGSVEEFRTSQVVWAAVAVAVVLGVGLLRAAAGRPPAPALVALLAASAAVLGVVACDKSLTRRVVRTRAQLLVELPAAAELVALAVAAGEGPSAALERVTRIGSGALSRELGRVLADARNGASLSHALESFAARCEVTAVRRFADAIVVAVERGTPLAGVLRAQAADARDAARRDLMERAARREVLMLLPVVFLVLPVSVLFALFPGFYGLTLTVV